VPTAGKGSKNQFPLFIEVNERKQAEAGVRRATPSLKI
jgi:hypothetical protein